MIGVVHDADGAGLAIDVRIGMGLVGSKLVKVLLEKVPPEAVTGYIEQAPPPASELQ